jgi:hypothetical protein
MIHDLEEKTIQGTVVMTNAKNPSEWDLGAEMWFCGLITLFSFNWDQ